MQGIADDETADGNLRRPVNTYSFKPHTRRFLQLVLHGHDEEAESLLKDHPEIAVDRNASHETPLHWLSVENMGNAVDILVRHGADVNARDHYGDSVLMDAASLGLTDIMKVLLVNKADPMYRHPHSQETALHTAARHSPNGEVVDLLIAHGADINARNHLGETPLHEAAAFSNIPVAVQLLANGADRKARNEVGATPSECLPLDAPQELKAQLQSA